MEQIEQLKSMRDAAQERLRANPDFKLKNSLDALIDDLESFISSDGGSVGESAVEVETQDELVASDDEEEQQPGGSVVDEPVVDELVTDEEEQYLGNPVADEEVPDDLVQADDVQIEATAEIEASLDELDEETEIAAVIAESISAAEIDVENDINGTDFGDTTQLDLEAEAAIEALEAELSQSETDIDQLTPGSR